MAERVQKILARAGVASRRACEELIRAGRVTVNGRVVTLGESAEATDAIKVDGKRIVLPAGDRYVLLNKPKGYITSKSDPEGRPTVMDLVPASWRRGLVPVGRLDFNTEGLLLLTTDGELAQRVAHPRYGCRKSYVVKVKGRPSRELIRNLRAGVVIEGRRTSPAVIRPFKAPGARDAANSWWTVEIAEGRTRQIREMFFRIGHPVQKLRRVAIGTLKDPRLPPGETRELTAAEVAALMAGAGEPPQGARRRPGSRGAPPKGAARKAGRS
ncbi:MAG: rRNA pseudouridine synthase [Acidobacteriota bacterium]|nr:rRNA pseudouridine synthase [Acidobacteriota bacterium]MDH3524252.1 rRNA pseudouridine synthase [Acidobacteriota bacterium]